MTAKSLDKRMGAPSCKQQIISEMTQQHSKGMSMRFKLVKVWPLQLCENDGRESYVTELFSK